VSTEEEALAHFSRFEVAEGWCITASQEETIKGVTEGRQEESRNVWNRVMISVSVFLLSFLLFLLGDKMPVANVFDASTVSSSLLN
jgi:hypothetical protein